MAEKLDKSLIKFEVWIVNCEKSKLGIILELNVT